MTAADPNVGPNVDIDDIGFPAIQSASWTWLTKDEIRSYNYTETRVACYDSYTIYINRTHQSIGERVMI